MTIFDTQRAAWATPHYGAHPGLHRIGLPGPWVPAEMAWGAEALKMNAADRAVTPPDLELIERISHGDQASFSTLYERYFPRVYRFVDRRINNRADVEEIVQEVFTNIFASLESFRSDAPFGAWVFGVSRITIANRFKKKRPPTVPIDLQDESQMIGNTGWREPTPLEHYECQERWRLLNTAADRDLSPIQRRMFVMHHLQHQSIREIARVTNKSADAVKSDLYRARRTLLAL